MAQRRIGRGRFLGGLATAWAAFFFIGAGFRVLADCTSFGLPFTDLGATGFCAQIAEAYDTGLSNGTSATTYSPSANVPREQMAAFVTRTLDASLARGSRRAALAQWWNSTPHYDQGLGLTTVGFEPEQLKSDGADVWVANAASASVSRVSARDGKLLGTWTGATGAFGILIAMGRVFVTGTTNPGSLYMINPTEAPGAVVTLTTNLGEANGMGGQTEGIDFDGNNIWTANVGNPAGSVSIVTPGTWNVTSVATGFSRPIGILFDGTNVWVTDADDFKLKRLDANGAVTQSVALGGTPRYPAFDGHNLWVPIFSKHSLTVVRASDGAVLKTFSAEGGNQNGLNNPTTAAFDGQRVLVTNALGGSVSLFRATDLSVIGTFPTTGISSLTGACSDGLSFWIAGGSASLARF